MLICLSKTKEACMQKLFQVTIQMYRLDVIKHLKGKMLQDLRQRTNVQLLHFWQDTTQYDLVSEGKSGSFYELDIQQGILCVLKWFCFRRKILNWTLSGKTTNLQSLNQTLKSITISVNCISPTICNIFNMTG